MTKERNNKQMICKIRYFFERLLLRLRIIREPKAINVLPDTRDGRDYYYSVRAPLGMETPSAMDLSGDFTAVEDQGAISSCVANALVGVCEYYKNFAGQGDELSRLFAYYIAREHECRENRDAGVSIRSAIKMTMKHGIPGEFIWPYEYALVNIKPSAEAFADAKARTIITRYERVSGSRAVRDAILHAKPVIFSMHLRNSFGFPDERGRISWPMSGNPVGGHAMIVVGYDDNEGLFRVRNSWGAGWGEAGYCYIPYGAFDSAELMDAWVIEMRVPEVPK